MQFNPRSEKELQQDNERLLLPARKEPYPARVKSAADKVSKKGNEMIEINLTVFADDGTTRFVTDYLMEAMMHKLFHFAEATGLMDAYSQGTICADDCEGKELFVKIGVEPASGDFAAKNVVKDYFSPKSEERHEAAKTEKKAPTFPPRPPADDDLDMRLSKTDLPF